jgi:hypothetical protein
VTPEEKLLCEQNEEVRTLFEQLESVDIGKIKAKAKEEQQVFKSGETLLCGVYKLKDGIPYYAGQELFTVP